jgi:hypothetical protein
LWLFREKFPSGFKEGKWSEEILSPKGNLSGFGVLFSLNRDAQAVKAFESKIIMEDPSMI